MRQIIPRPLTLTCLLTLALAPLGGCSDQASQATSPAATTDASTHEDSARPRPSAGLPALPAPFALDPTAARIPSAWSEAPNTAAPPRADARHALEAADAALARLPGDTPLVVATGDLDGLLDQLGRERLAARYPDYAAALAAPLRELTGHDLLDPARFEAVGLDGEGPAGVAWLDPALELGVAFVSVRDPKRALETLDAIVERAGPNRLAREVTDTSVRLHAAAEGGAVVLTADTLYWVFAVPGDARVVGVSDSIASAAAGGLTEQRNFDALGARLVSGRHLAGYLALERILAARSAVTATWADHALAAARRRSADADEIAELEATVERLQRRTEREAALWRTLLGQGGPVVFGIEVDAPGLRLELHAALPDDALLRAALRPPTALPAALHSGDDDLLAVASLTLEPTDLLPAVELVDGLRTSPDEPNTRQLLTTALGVDPLAALAEVTTGELGLLVTGELAEDVETPLPEELGVHLVVGLEDPSAARALIERLSGHALLRDHVEVPDDDDEAPHWTWTVPGVGRLRLQLDDTHLVLSTAPTFVDRVLGGQRGQLVRDDAEASTFVIESGSSAAIVVALDARWLAWWPVAAPPAHGPLPDVGEEPDRKVRRKLRAIAAVDEELDDAWVRAARARRRRLLGPLTELATIGVSITPSSDGVIVRGGLYGERSLASLVDTWLAAWLELSLRGDSVEIERLHEQRDRLVGELEALLAR